MNTPNHRSTHECSHFPKPVVDILFCVFTDCSTPGLEEDTYFTRKNFGFECVHIPLEPTEDINREALPSLPVFYEEEKEEEKDTSYYNKVNKLTPENKNCVLFNSRFDSDSEEEKEEDENDYFSSSVAKQISKNSFSMDLDTKIASSNTSSDGRRSDQLRDDKRNSDVSEEQHESSTTNEMEFKATDADEAINLEVSEEQNVSSTIDTVLFKTTDVDAIIESDRTEEQHESSTTNAVGFNATDVYEAIDLEVSEEQTVSSTTGTVLFKTADVDAIIESDTSPEHKVSTTTETTQFNDKNEDDHNDVHSTATEQTSNLSRMHDSQSPTKKSIYIMKRPLSERFAIKKRLKKVWRKILGKDDSVPSIENEIVTVCSRYAAVKNRTKRESKPSETHEDSIVSCIHHTLAAKTDKDNASSSTRSMNSTESASSLHAVSNIASYPSKLNEMKQDNGNGQSSHSNIPSFKRVDDTSEHQSNQDEKGTKSMLPQPKHIQVDVAQRIKDSPKDIKDVVVNDDDPWTAAKRGDLITIQRLVNQTEEQPPRSIIDWSKEDDFGNTPLYYACHSGAGVASSERKGLLIVKSLLNVWPGNSIPEHIIERCKMNAINSKVSQVLRDYEENIASDTGSGSFVLYQINSSSSSSSGSDGSRNGCGMMMDNLFWSPLDEDEKGDY